MRLFKSSKRKKQEKKRRNQKEEDDAQIAGTEAEAISRQKKKKKSLLKRIFKSNKKKKKGDTEKDHTETRGERGVSPSPTSRSVTEQEAQQQLKFEDELFKERNDAAEGNASQDLELKTSSSLHAPLSDFRLKQQAPPATVGSGNAFLKLPSSPLPIYTDDEDDDYDNYDHHQSEDDKNLLSTSRSRRSSDYPQQHTESLDVTQELSFSSSLSIWTKNSTVKVTRKGDDGSTDDFYNDDLNATGDSSLEGQKDSGQEESEEEKTFNGLFEDEVNALEDTLSQILGLSDQEDSNSSRTGGSLNKNKEEELPVAVPESPPHRSLILPNLSPIKSSVASPNKSVPIPAAPKSPLSPITNLDDVASSTLAVSPPSSPLQLGLKQRTRQDRFGLDNASGGGAAGAAGSVNNKNSITRSYFSKDDDEASMSTNNSIYLDCIHADNADVASVATSLATTDNNGEVCNNLLVQFDEYSNQYSLGLQVRTLVQERDELLASQQKERELHQSNYKAFCEKIQSLEQTCQKQRDQRQSLVEQLAHHTVLHRQSVVQLSMLRKQQQLLQEQQQKQQAKQRQQQDENPWTQLTVSAPTPVGDDLFDQVQKTVQQEGAAILDRFLLDDHNREQLEQQLEDSLNERHQLVAKFGQELGIQLARYKQLDDRFKAEQTKYNRQVGLNAQLEQQVFHLKQDYEELDEKYTHLQDWQAAIIRKHERQQKRTSPPRGKDKWTGVLGGRGNDDDDSDIQIMEA
ncbi:MAG: hypothetical protein SGBAC_011410 [Bacillariaceae sp.]